jgi:cytochrome c-type biogenesis protein CcmF
VTAALGMAALAGGLVASAVAATGWSSAARGGSARAARVATYALLLCAVLAAGALEWALVSHDFSVRFVAENGGRQVPLYYTVTSMWGALEGSLLLWLLVLGIFAVAAMRRVPTSAPALHPVAMAVIAGVAVFFFALALGGGNAFHTVSPVPADGPGPNPLLQDHPAMGIHPPLLYAGYVGLTVPFAYSVAALVTGRVDRGWVRAVRGWTLVAWGFLTAGIVLGAWWSYAVLGWGGYWAWDPVENASLLPWLTATALLHSVLVQAYRRTLRIWNVSLAAASFFLVLVGTFLTRSGVVDSVHAFSESPLGPMLLGFLITVLLGWIGLVVWRADRLAIDDEGLGGHVLSRQTALVGNNVLLSIIAFTVLLGTVFPLVYELLTADQVSVGPPYFSRMVAPAAFALLLLMAVGPLLSWDGNRPGDVLRRISVPAIAALVTIGILGLLRIGGVQVLLSIGLAVFVLTSLTRELVVRAGPRTSTTGLVRRILAGRRPIGVFVAHAGVVLAAVAVTVSSAGSEVEQRTVSVGDAVVLGDVSATLLGVDRSATEEQMSATARLAVAAGGQGGGQVLEPRLTFFIDRSMVVASPAIDSSLRRDVYLTVLEVDPQAATATVRLAVNPLIGLLWASGGILLVGAGLAAWPRRRSRAAEAATGAPQVQPGHVPKEVLG